ncbi:hypothetical protein PH586_21475 [Pseudomonas sp. SA3-5]|uniref:Wadjet protein JetD C-terminal domain-containing protein n=1 Tax=Pseudomonas aestuarii TaxID=3018340 RepID=A0ABT4XL49_9PSED|nr:hypothetical protein [Pseudomonas aestuarii]MDA7088956.1 hypothetical protein [Pseudomonas aestuarii]
MSNIYRYLSSISAGHPINFEVFAKELRKQGKGAGYLHDTFSASKIGKSSYQVAVLREDRFAELLREHAPSEVTGRIGAAFDGNSHAVAVSGSILITRSVVHPHPSVVLLSKHGWDAPNTPRPAALLVENLENFLALEQTVDILADCGVTEQNENLDFIFGAGNQITSRLNMPFLSQYQRLYCLFDADLGGLTMYRTLLKGLPEGHRVVFVYPDDIAHRLSASKCLLNQQTRHDLLEFVGLSKETNELIGFMRGSHRALEQETYLMPATTRD